MEGRKNYKSLVVLTSVALFIAGTLFFLYNYAFVEISLSSSNSDTYSVSLQKGSSSDIESLTSDKPTIKKFVKRGDYELAVSQEKESYYSLIKVGGFLTTTIVSADLKPESQRSFVGDNPAPCMYLGDSLASSSCGGKVRDITKHVPATTSSSTYADYLAPGHQGIVEGFVRTNSGDYLISKAGTGEDQRPPHTAHPINQNLNLGAGIYLQEARPGISYRVLAYKDGFVLFDDNLDAVLYYESPDSKPDRIKTERPEDKSFAPVDIGVLGDKIITTYTNNTSGDIADIDDVDSSGVTTQIFVNAGNSTTSFSLNKEYSKVRLCGAEYICALRGSTIDLYVVSGTSLTKTSTIHGVSDFVSSDSSLLIVKSEQIIQLDLDSLEGHFVYSTNDYKICGLQQQKGEFVICLINERSQKRALLIRPETQDQDNIDEKVAVLLKTKEIKNLSIYKNFVFISPDYGESKRDDSGSFGFDEVTKQRANAAIDKALQESGIDLSVYMVKRTLN